MEGDELESFPIAYTMNEKVDCIYNFFHEPENYLHHKTNITQPVYYKERKKRNTIMKRKRR
jgi:hypothetical protein